MQRLNSPDGAIEAQGGTEEAPREGFGAGAGAEEDLQWSLVLPKIEWTILIWILSMAAEWDCFTPAFLYNGYGAVRALTGRSDIQTPGSCEQ